LNGLAESPTFRECIGGMIMGRVLALIGSIALFAGCGTPQDLAEAKAYGAYFNTPLSKMEKPQTDALASMPLHTTQFRMRDLCGIARINKNDAASMKIIAPHLRRAGFTAREVEIASDPRVTFGTGISFTALTCMEDVQVVNEAFYPGLGHQWQVKVGGSYVYFEGDGTPAGMRVRAWN